MGTAKTGGRIRRDFRGRKAERLYEKKSMGFLSDIFFCHIGHHVRHDGCQLLYRSDGAVLC